MKHSAACTLKVRINWHRLRSTLSLHTPVPSGALFRMCDNRAEITWNVVSKSCYDAAPTPLLMMMALTNMQHRL